MVRLLLDWLSTGRFPREEFTFRWSRFGVLLAVSVGVFVAFLVLLVVGVELGLVGDE